MKQTRDKSTEPVQNTVGWVTVPMTFNQAAGNSGITIADTIIKKQTDYGQNNILGCPVGAEMGLIVRLFDKLNRLANLYKQGKPPTNESLKDTWLDIAGYGMIGMMLCDGTFQLPLGEGGDIDAKR
jgi:hypothetical protein